MDGWLILLDALIAMCSRTGNRSRKTRGVGIYFQSAYDRHNDEVFPAELGAHDYERQTEGQNLHSCFGLMVQPIK